MLRRLNPALVLAVAFAASLALDPAPLWSQPAQRPSKQYTIEQFMATTSVNGASFSPDETKILFSSNESGVFNAYTVPVAGGKPTALTRSTTDSTFGVSYFPKDERVLFTRDQVGNELNHLYVRESDGQERDLTPGEKLKAIFAGWSHDGESFFVLTNERDARFFDVYRYSAKEYQRTLFYKDEVGYQVGAISDDQKWIALGKPNSTADSDIHLWSVAASQMKHITPHQGMAQYSTADFDPASKYLYYLTNDGG
jgi:Tol biopolymer transport system component